MLYLQNSDTTSALDYLGANWSRICLSMALNHGTLWHIVFPRLRNILNYLLTCLVAGVLKGNWTGDLYRGGKWPGTNMSVTNTTVCLMTVKQSVKLSWFKDSFTTWLSHTKLNTAVAFTCTVNCVNHCMPSTDIYIDSDSHSKCSMRRHLAVHREKTED